MQETAAVRPSVRPLLTEEALRLFRLAKADAPKNWTVKDDGFHDGGHICSLFRIIGHTSPSKRIGYGLLVELVAPDGKINSVILPREKLDAHPRAAVGMLGNAGLQTFTDYKRVISLIRAWSVPLMIEVVDRAGWTDDQSSYIFPDGRIVSKPDAVVVRRLSNPSLRSQRGTFEGWKEGVAAACIGKP